MKKYFFSKKTSKYICRNKKKMYLCTAVKLVHKIGLWCNGNTADFGSVIRGSNPCRPTTFIIIFKNLELAKIPESFLGYFCFWQLCNFLFKISYLP